MNKRLIGGIIVLAVIIASVSMFILMRNRPDTEPIVKINPPTAKDLQKIEQKIKNDLAAQKAAEQQLSQETGHRHADGTWHEGEHDYLPDGAIDSEEIDIIDDSEEIKKVLKILSDAGIENFNYTSPLTPEEQEVYVNIKANRVAMGKPLSHTGLKLLTKLAVSSLKMKDIMVAQKVGDITKEEAQKQLKKTKERYYYD